MRISEYFKLGKTQPFLGFVDVRLDTDIPVFLDPTAIKSLNSTWGQECASLIQYYFESVLKRIKSEDHNGARILVSSLTERNEFHLGFSSGISRGRGFGAKSAVTVWGALSQSLAAKSGLLKDLEDTCLLIEGIGRDMISDAVSNIIRGPLIKYTQDMCRYYGIPLTHAVSSGPMWNLNTERWESEYVSLPMTSYGKVILVPKIAVRHRQSYEHTEYYNDYLLPAMQSEELAANTGLVELLKNGNRRVTKKSLKEKYGSDKLAVVKQTLRHPKVLEAYKNDKARNTPPPLDHEQFSEIENVPIPAWDALIDDLGNVHPGNADAEAYERLVEEILSALFYPSLCNPTKQHKIHDGRKRIDITYTNEADAGFFFWISQHYPSAFIFVECKNYGKEIGNPEIDQLSGRFSPSRGKIGLLVCRTLDNPRLLDVRCKDTAMDDRGFIICLTDDDLTSMMIDAKKGKQSAAFPLLAKKFRALID